MSTTSAHGLLVEDWAGRRDPAGARLELIDGGVVVNPAPRPLHQDVCRYLADAIEGQCPAELKASVDVEWRHLSSAGGIVIDALRPDVVVAPRHELRRVVALTEAPVLAVEVLSPGNRKAELANKRSIYLTNGLAH